MNTMAFFQIGDPKFSLEKLLLTKVIFFAYYLLGKDFAYCDLKIYSLSLIF